jgi:hypothetical protein
VVTELLSGNVLRITTAGVISEYPVPTARKSRRREDLAPVDIPTSTDELDSFSPQPDGRRFLASIATRPFNIWMPEGFEPRPKTWFERLLRR